jgi:ribosomal protein S18 acetylase RimI-like enzyme
VTPDDPAGAGLHWRRLNPADAAAVDALHRHALGTLDDPDWVRLEAAAFFAAVLGPDGFGLGVEADGRLIAYGLVQTRLEAEDAAALPWGAGAHPTAKLCGAAVEPDWRGRGLQAALASERMREGRALGYGRFFATAAPGNVPSWASLLRAGMQVAALGPRYGGLLRYTLVADGRRPDGPVAAIPLADAAAQAARLALGWRGTALRREPPPALEFRPCGA